MNTKIPIDSKNPNFNFSENDLLHKQPDNSEYKPNLMADKISTDMRFDLLANQNKINFQIHDSPIINADNADNGVRDSDLLSSDKPASNGIIEYSNEESNSHVSPRNISVAKKTNSDEPPNLMNNTHDAALQSVIHPKESEKIPQMTQREIRGRKIELLRIFAELKEKGYSITPYNISSNLEDMEQEYSILKNMQNKKNSIKLYKSFIMNTVGAMEFMNDNYNPFDFQLTGWNDHENKKMETGYYDDVLEEVHEKYKSSGKQVEPEIKLLLMMVASGATFHATQSINIPGIDKILERNPSLTNNFLSNNDSSQKKDTHFPTLNKSKQMKGPDPHEFLKNMKNNIQKNNPSSPANSVNHNTVQPSSSNSLLNQSKLASPPNFSQVNTFNSTTPLKMEASLVESDSVTRSSQQRRRKKDTNSSERQRKNTLKMSI